MFQAIILGLVQGLTEFLPISSSGHLVLAQHLFGFNQIDPAFDVFVQGGTVISVLIYFRHQLLHLTRRYLSLLLIASLPAAIIGLLLGNYIDAIFSSLFGVALGFFLTTLLVWSTKHLPQDTNKLATKNVLKIGFAQACAILPGLSRSGTTITIALFLGISPSDAFNFSFLLSIPVVAGASLLSIRHLTWDTGLTNAYIIGFLIATISGYFSLLALAKLMKKGKFYLFAPYTFLLSVISLILALSR
ncbi:MAG: undecaprenyl-diphosphate phosphatase [bacterium]